MACDGFTEETGCFWEGFPGEEGFLVAGAAVGLKVGWAVFAFFFGAGVEEGALVFGAEVEEGALVFGAAVGFKVGFNEGADAFFFELPEMDWAVEEES